MGRPGAGGGHSTSHHSSGGSHRVSSHSSGSVHRVGGSSRPSSSFSMGRPMSNTNVSRPKPTSSSFSPPPRREDPGRRMPPPPMLRRQVPPPPMPFGPERRMPPPPPRYHAPRTTVYVERESSSDEGYSAMGIFISVLIIIAICLGLYLFFYGGKSNTYDSQLERTKLSTGNAFMNDCVRDELGWVNETKVAKGLKQFWEDTGAQPYIYLCGSNELEISDEMAYQYATAWYDDQFADRQDVVLYMYFEDPDPYAVGPMALIHGNQSGAIMDSEAEEIFWNILDDDWSTYSEDETDEMFIDIFTRTGNSIMYHRTNGWDVMKVIVILAIIACVALAIILTYREFCKREKEKAEETERILKTNLNDLADDKADDLLDKYK